MRGHGEVFFHSKIEIGTPTRHAQGDPADASCACCARGSGAGAGGYLRAIRRAAESPPARGRQRIERHQTSERSTLVSSACCLLSIAGEIRILFLDISGEILGAPAAFTAENFKKAVVEFL